MFTEDLSDFIDVDDFAVAAVVDGSAVNGILSNEFVSADFVESQKPVFDCASADIVGVAHGDTVTIGSYTYKVRGIQHDGTGMTRLILELQ